ncbi:MAG: acetoacetate--CoA ligase [Thauera sp.]|uniref:acetoacetate--CoA ligase n=1 Tax=Thauera sp. TaxID=1905334 RepID=UPI000FBF8691|nr:acetoacetate--CoA ligase [Thauera sp.]MCP5224928.1 acetoacetate--CoA ligase [Thauera sp.]RTL24666.1 MAG: acetoacetate--CoA ligase [Rhodocyclaceae bacterium]HPE04619.1 acetoacetate--CoA ligase [Thauera sp.]
MYPTEQKPLWTPSPERIAAARVTAFRLAAAQRWGVALPDYEALHAWSVAQPEQFWTSVWEGDGVGGGVIGTRGERVLVDGHRMPGAKWFPDARLNFAQNLLRSRDAHDAIVFWGEERVKNRLSHGELYRAVAHFAAALKEQGVVAGDRVAAYMPNLPETVIAMLAAASIGAIFTSASPDFGVQGVLDRFGQTEPKVLVACDGYYYGGKTVDVLGKLGEIVSQLPSVKRVVVVPYVHAEHDLSHVPHARMYADFIAPFHFVDDIEFAELPFDHPLYIMYSSGTTGVPKCIVHCAGGALLQHLKEHKLHGDVKPGDRVFYFTTCGWMMWNWLVSALAAEATLLLYDGSPFAGDNQILFDYADAEHMTHFGTSAKFLDAAAKFGLKPRETHRLETVRAMMSTGSPLVPEGFDYVYRDIKADLQLSSISGGTDIISCFVLGSPVLPVWRGEIQCRGLGMAVDVWDDDGRPVRGEKGELVCSKPFPVMPIGFWNDADGSKYHAAYFDRFDNVWCHGDFCEITAHGGLVIYGRSDATLNPGGVRIGTAEIYRQVEKLHEVVESLVIGQDWPPQNPNDVRVVLFVKLREGVTLDDELTKRIRQTIRDNTTPRHVPAKVLQVADIPRTKSGKIVELAVRNVVHGRAVKNQEALANPEALAHFRDRAELQG